jgi:hypothetical protein
MLELKLNLLVAEKRMKPFCSYQVAASRARVLESKIGN